MLPRNSATRTEILQTPSAGTRWEPARRPSAGWRELHWFEANKAKLTNYEGLWIAVYEDGVVASALTAEEVVDQVSQLGLSDCLVVKVEQARTERYLIA